MNKQPIVSVVALTAALTASLHARNAKACSTTDLCISDGVAQSIQYSGSGTGLFVESSHNGAVGIEGYGNQYGVFGNGAGTGIGVYGSSSSGQGVYGVSSTATGVRGNSTSGTGVYGTTAGSSSSGVAAYNTGGQYGLYAQSSTSPGQGVHATGYKYGIWATSTGGTTGTDFAGFFQGDVKITGALTTGSCTGCSDIRMKQNVKPLGDAIDQLLKLRGVTYEWTDPSIHGNETGTINGFIA